MPRDTLHVVRADVLLWTLGGFASAEFASGTRVVPVWQIREMAELAKSPLLPDGEGRRLAARYGRSAKSIRIQLSQLRTGRRLLRGWRQVLAEDYR